MRTVALKGLAGRKLRSFLTAMAVVLGVAMVSGTLIFSDTIQKAFDQVFETSYGDTSVVVSGRKVVDSPTTPAAPVAAALVARIEQVPGVAVASGQIVDLTGSQPTTIMDARGKVISGDTALGMGMDPRQPRFNPLHLTAGRWASGPGQVVIDAATARDHHLHVGSRVLVAADGPRAPFTVVGLARFGSIDSLGGATVSVFDVPTAQVLQRKQGRFDTISIAATRGVSEQELTRRIARVLPPSAQVRTADDQAHADSRDTREAIKIIRIFLLVFGVIALFVGAFVIFNTLSITLTQRTRELATLRTLGATRRQVLRAVLLEALVLGLLASAAGLALGVALDGGLNALLKALGADAPDASLVIAPRTILVALLGGVSVTVIASLAPALRATRVPPIAAVRDGATLAPSRLARHAPMIAAFTTVLGIAALVAGMFASMHTTPRLVLLGLGLLTLFVGVGLVSPRLVRPLAAVVGLPARRFGGPAGRLARDNALRNPSRTAATAAALMIGLALYAFVATLGEGIRSSTGDALREQVRADYIVSTKNTDDDSAAFPGAAGDAVARAPGVQTASSVRGDTAKVDGDTLPVTGVDPATIARAYAFRWNQGSDSVLTALGRDGAIVDTRFADDHDLGVGDRMVMLSPAGRRAVLVVRGIYDPPKGDPILGPVVVSQRAFDAAFPRKANLFTFVNIRAGSTPATTRRLERVLAPYPDAGVSTRASWIDGRAHSVDTILQLFYVLLGLSVVVSLFGMVNTLVLSIFERTRELGMLRAVGLTRRQTRRMVRHESVIIALIGAALGLPVGLALAALVTHALADEGATFKVPVGSLIAFTTVALVAGILAAVFPARRAARLNVLDALHYE
jgi:putative ABC transport system permease protein